MADQTNPNADSGKSYDFLPRFYQSDANKKFLQATVDQLTKTGTVKKVNGFIGRENAKATTGNDVFLAAPDANRQNYQLEPGLVINDQLGNNTFFKDYQDYINQLNVFGGNTENHARVNSQEFYSWDPHIDWDKFINFQQYYWLPYGPDAITIFGQKEKVTSEYKIEIEAELDNNEYVFYPTGLVRNPTIKLYRGQTYKFNVNSPGNPFTIKTRRTPGSDQDLYVSPTLENNVVEKGTVTFTVPFNSPDVLYYLSSTDTDLGGIFQIESIDDNTYIDVSSDIIGKINYTLPDGTQLSNGMKVRFVGNVTPAEYATGYYYVEGVGTSIKLINESVLEIISTYTTSESILFDTTPFDNMPFSDATSFAGTKDYIVINRGSQDHNPWSRINRWFHKDVIEASAKVNGKIASVDQTSRAVRPIIEFEANLKLFNFGIKAVDDVDLVDTFTTDVFSNIEGQLGYSVDGVSLIQGTRVLFTADTDRLVKNKIYRVNFVTIQGQRQIHLELENEPVDGNVVLVKQGQKYQGTMFWYNGSSWNIGQQKTSLNQAPYFDIFNSDGVSYSDTSAYDGSTFAGTKIFSYKIGTGKTDSNLGFALSYKNINNIGDIVFNFDILKDTFQYKTTTNVLTQSINVGYLKKTSNTGSISYVNGWQVCSATTIQAGVRIYKNSKKLNKFDIDLFDDITNLSDLVVKIYVNGIRLGKENWTVNNGPVYKYVLLNTDILESDVLTIKAYAKQPINKNGFYEIPVNLQNNPLNESIDTFTLGEVSDHVNSIVDNLTNFSGVYPGPNNLRDLGNITAYGTKFVQHSGPMSLSLYHITSEDNNIIRALEEARNDYNKFKRNFIVTATTLGVDTHPIKQLDLILQKINKDKPKTAPYYFSDMVPYGASIVTTLSVVDHRIKTYPLSNVFNLDSLSNSAVIIYHNDNQLLYGKEYTFDAQGFIVITEAVDLQEDDSIVIYEYPSTTGCFIPPTPTKLGIWPKYEPKKYLDTTLVTPREMIQGHDGSLILAYGDYRDDLILELEKRIYNNIKVEYNPDIFDIDNVVPSYNRDTDYSLEEFNQVLAPSFYKWLTFVDKDFTKPLSYDRTNSLTFNYRGHAAPDGRETPGYWRGVYRWLLGTDRPNICPWEMLGFSLEPSWWTSVYGPAPYTKDNIPLWTDLSNGVVKEPGVPPVVLKQYVRPFLLNHIPVDSNGNVVSPLVSGLAEGVITSSTSGDFVFGDVSPIEAAWRRSSYYPFSVLIASMILQPAKTFGTLLDRSRIVRNLAGQLVYSETGLRISPKDIVLPSIYSSTTNKQTAGIINYIVDYILSDNLKSYKSYSYDLLNVSAQLSYRIGAFTSKEKFNLILDSKTPLSQGSVFVPQEDYNIILNSSSPVKKISYSAVIVTKLSDGYEIKGYSLTTPYFKYYPWLQSGIPINVGGISESYSLWTPGSQYAAGKIVEYSNKYYRSKALHTAGSTFDLTKYQSLPSLPIIGGRNAILRKSWDRTDPITVPYGTKFTNVQDVVDFLLGYGEYLKDQGFIFDEFNPRLAAVTNWETSAKEFLFWTTQNWSSGQDKWDDWLPNNEVKVGSIVKYNGDYYRAIRNVEANPIFVEEDYTKLDGLSSIGSSVLSLSPSATKVTFSAPLSVVDNITNPFNSYEIFKVDGTPLEPIFLNSYREDNAVSYSPRTEDGIFGATFYLIQQEQVVILNNTTMFNDTIYNPVSGYRQERIKVSGYTSANWYGGFDVPGFIFDQAKIQSWEQWQDYALGDIVKYKEFYYSAQKFIPGSETFVATDWVKLSKSPTQQLLPNWSYKASQFTDFYSLDSDNFDLTQQQLAQHLVGYQKRQYLDNIIQDDVSEFKFYQGMIQEKGTKNSLNKLFDVLSASDKESLTFYEEWAVRVGQYGASASFENIEFKLDESIFKNNPQGFELVNTVNESIVDFIIRQTPNDVYLKPLGYNNNPWPIITDFKPFLRTPGYVRSDEVTVTLNTVDEILNQDVTKFSDGSYIWCGFEGASWNVYRYSETNLTVDTVAYDLDNKIITVNTTTPVTFIAGTYIGITGTSLFDGFYQVATVGPTSFTLIHEISWNPPFTEQAHTHIFALSSQRVSKIDEVELLFPGDVVSGELLWTDDSGNGKWATWQHYPVYTETEILNALPADGYQFGRQVLINAAGSIAAISNNEGQVTVYDKSSPAAPWIERQTITPPFIALAGLLQPTPDSDTGDVLAISGDGTWLATGTPTATNVTSHYNGSEWDSLSTYALNEIVYYTVGIPEKTGYYQQIVIPPTPSNNYPPHLNPNYWRKLPYVPVDPTGTNSVLSNQGVISIYKKDVNNIFTLVNTILSPEPMDDELFGSNLVFGDNTLFISAPGTSGSGSVYQLSYKTTVEATASFNPVGTSGSTIKVSSVQGQIYPGMTIVGTGFTSGQTVFQVVDDSTIVLNAAPDTDPSGTFEFTLTRWQFTERQRFTADPGENNFGTAMAISKDSKTLLINSSTPGNLYIYSQSGNVYTQTQKIVGGSLSFGNSLAVSDSSEWIAVSDITYGTNRGRVILYHYNTNTHQYQTTTITSQDDVNYAFNPQIIVGRQTSIDSYFGYKLAFMNDHKTLVIFSNNSTGKVDVYDRYASSWIYSESLSNPTNLSDGYGTGFAVGSNYIFVSAPSAVDQTFVSGKVYEYSKMAGAYSWSIVHQQIDKPDVSKIKQAFLYNTVTNKLITYLDVIDPTQGRIPGLAEQELKYKTYYDPAVYYAGNSNVTVDDGIQWGPKQVGMLWWDLRTAKFLDSSDNEIVYRNSTWSTLFPGASIDVYEWVSSNLMPDDWNAIADTEEGLALGISGKTLYDNTTYSRVTKYDNVANSFVYTYYYWVKNKATIPNISSRMMSAKDVAMLIENPRGYGYKYLALTGSNSFSLVNAKPLLQDDNVALSVEYWIVDEIDRNVHTEWKLISSDSNSYIPTFLEQKWVDSLCGKDVKGRLVPDITLPLKARYGIENRPLQSMFVNRFEALKQIIEQTNRILIQHQIAEQKDLTQLESYDTQPNVILGMYDTTVDTDAELRFAEISNFIKPSLTPVIVNGTITEVTIVDKGNGYIVAPYIDVVGSGNGAKIRTVINSKGQIIGATIVDGGVGYNDSTSLVLRNYSVLVKNDSQADGNWSIYAYETLTKVWSRVQSQTYDTRRYWDYVDWFETGYNQFTAIDYAVNTMSDLGLITATVGQLVKVLRNSAGNWTLLYKYSDVNSIDWTQNYKVVGLEKGTIQLSTSLYDFSNSPYGYDGSLYDGSIFDNSASLELRNILIAIKSNLFIDDLKDEYLKLFFTGIRYALSEQNYIDWAFKSSFVKVHHNVGDLKQKVTYNNDNLSDFESYVNEVKPYRTKIREYVSTYNNLDLGKMSISDFDLPPIYENGKITTIDATVVNGSIESSSNQIINYPWKHWLDNAGYVVTSVPVVDAGTGYLTEPVVRFASNSGSGATARAFISNGKLTKIVLLTPGSGYLSAPTITLDGGLGVNGTPARAVAIIGNSAVRSTLVKMKFDRITKEYYYTTLQHTETKVGTGSRLQWPLVWAPDVRIGVSTVTVDGVDALRDDYKLLIVKSTTRGYTSYSGSVIFDTAPANGAEIKITYLKDWSLLNAADRIQYYYNPAPGELGKDLSQLMTGIDYGGVIVSGMSFSVNAGWGELPYYSDKWDSFDTEFDDYIVQVAANTHSFDLPYVPAANEELNIYHAPKNVDSYVSDGTTLNYNFSIFDVFPTKVIAIVTKNINTSSLVGSDTLILDDVEGLKLGDTLSIPSAPNSVSYTATVTQIIPLTNTVKLDQIFFATIPNNIDAVFTRELVVTRDYTIPINGLLTLFEPVYTGGTIEITAYFGFRRIDDPNFNTPEQSIYAVMFPFIADGLSNVVSIPNTYVINDGDKITIRKSTSDGSIKPQEGDYDSSISGGSLAQLGGVYTTATGKTAEEIIIDGDGFITPTTSPAPEEVVPGQVVDAVAIKVYDRPSNGSANIKVDSYISDGVNLSFKISQRPNSKDAVIVKTNTGIKTRDVDYTVDYKNLTVNFSTPIPDGETVSIFSIGFNGTNILDLDYYVGNGVTKEFVTKAPWISHVSYLVYVDGTPATVELFKTDNTYESSNRIGIRFINPPIDGSLINFIIVSGSQQTFAITKSEEFTGNGTDTYSLSNIIGDSLPTETSMIVRVNQQILKGPNNSYYTIKNNKLNYQIDPDKFVPYSVATNEIVVLANGIELTPIVDYTVDLSGITVKINKSIYKIYSGKELIISVRQNNGYEYIPSTPPQIKFSQAYTSNDKIEVIGSYRHNVLDIQRTIVSVSSTVSLTPDTPEFYTYKSLSYGILPLDREVLNDNYVWVLKNGRLLTPSIDFKVNPDRQTIKLAVIPDTADEYTLITFGSNVLSTGIAYMQFKDMLNRVIFKRLSSNKQTTLTKDLLPSDMTIEVADASNFDLPSPDNNKPGIIEISGERIEYFTLTGNVLGQIRRGTLGTGVRAIHTAGTFVQDIGASETIPYTEITTVKQLDGNGTNHVTVPFVPGNFDTSWKYKGKNMTAEQSTLLAKDAVEVFAGGVRLKKNPFAVYSPVNYPNSPEGDVSYPAEFTVTGTTNQLTTAASYPFGTRLTVVQRQGTAWDSEINIQDDNNKISQFLKARPGIWYSEIKKT